MSEPKLDRSSAKARTTFSREPLVSSRKNMIMPEKDTTRTPDHQVVVEAVERSASWLSGLSKITPDDHPVRGRSADYVVEHRF